MFVKPFKAFSLKLEKRQNEKNFTKTTFLIVNPTTTCF